MRGAGAYHVTARNENDLSQAVKAHYAAVLIILQAGFHGKTINTYSLHPQIPITQRTLAGA